MSRKTNDEVMDELFKEYELVYDKEDPKNSDVFITRQYKIITRSGIDKIEAKVNPVVEYKILAHDEYEVVIQGTFEKDGKSVTTIGEASIDRFENIVLSMSESHSEPVQDEDNNVILGSKTKSRSGEKVEKILIKKGNVGQNPPYLYAMAEKRCRSRAILRLAGLYDIGFYGEDEAEAFGDTVKGAKGNSNVSVS